MKDSPNCTVVEVTPSTARTKPRTVQTNGNSEPAMKPPQLEDAAPSNRKRRSEQSAAHDAPAKNAAKSRKRSRKNRNESESSEVEVKVTGKEVPVNFRDTGNRYLPVHG